MDACRLRVTGADVRLGTAEELPCEDSAFEAVLAQLVMQVLDDAPRARAAREMRRVAASGGQRGGLRVGFPRRDAAARRLLGRGGERRSRRGSAGGRRRHEPLVHARGLRQLWRGAALEEVETAELASNAEYAGLTMPGGHSPPASVPAARIAVRWTRSGERRSVRSSRRRLGAPEEPFNLTARAWSVRGRAPGA